MNRKEARIIAYIVTAFAEGGKIECRDRGTSEEWMDVTSPNFDFYRTEYRIKPNEAYRPWTFDEVPIGAKVRTKPGAGSSYSMYRGVITGVKIEAGTGVLFVSIGGHSRVDVQSLLDNWIGDNESSGDVCGKLV